MRAHRSRAVFRGSDRFEVHGHLGSGGMGSVYAVLDRERGARLALKTIGVADGQELLRFKREFRELRDLRHPNFVRLGELFEIDGEWSYTMELVDGIDLASYVRGSTASASHRPSADSLDATGEFLSCTPRAESDGRPHRVDLARLREAFAQLVDALATLHSHRKVHRDIKPANVLVERSGRVVLLDFGLVTDVSTGLQRTDVGAIGTFAYMAPEQASGKPVDARADWYSVGVMLFEALVGRPPFAVRSLADLARKVAEEAPDPFALAPSIPNDLGELCRGLLRRDPTERPSVTAIRERFGGAPARRSSYSALSRSPHPPEGTFVGRRHELSTLDEALARTIAGEPTMVRVTGELGIGKTVVVRRFLASAMERHPGLLDLRGRCPKHESMPFKGLDAIVDGLSGHLARLAKDEVSTLLPNELDVLATTFPVLRRLGAASGPRSRDPRDPRELRAVVFGGLRTLLGRVAARVPTIVWLDDAQWLDEDSASLLGEILRRPSAPAILVVVTERTEPDGSSESRIRSIADSHGAIEIPLARLGLDESIELASKRLASVDLVEAGWAERVGSESHGHPLFVDELARHVELATDECDSGELSLALAIESRRALTNELASRALDLVALAGAPLERRVLAASLGVDADSLDRCLAVLEALRLVRSEGDLPTSTVEPYHAIVADVAARSVPASETVSIHAAVATAMDALPDADPVERSRHWALAGESHRAAECAFVAADAASGALAFDLAAELLRRSLELEPHDGPGLENRRVRLARALANAGRGGEAGEAYEQAAATAEAAEAIELRRQSAEQFVLSGRIERGVAAFRALLGQLGIRYPRFGLESLLSIAWTTIVLAVRGFRIRERGASRVDPRDAVRADVCRSVSLGMLQTNTILGFDFQQRALVRALHLGDEERVAILLASQAGTLVASGRRRHARSAALLEQARVIAARAGSPYARGVCTYVEGMSHYLLGEWRLALRTFDAAERIFRDECSDASPEMRTLQAARIQCLWESGEWRRLGDHLSRAIKEADEHGDLFTSVTFRVGFRLRASCVDDSVERAIAEADVAIAQWTGEGFGVQQWLKIVHHAFASDYRDDEGRGFELLVAKRREATYSLLATVQLTRGGYARELGMRALSRALVVSGRERDELVAEAHRCARKLDREGALWATAAAEHIRGCAYASVGEVEKAKRALASATATYEANGMAGHVAATRWATGVLVGGDEGARMSATGLRYFEEQGVVQPERFARAMSPVAPSSGRRSRTAMPTGAR